jgi:hypothetical protein
VTANHSAAASTSWRSTIATHLHPTPHTQRSSPANEKPTQTRTTRASCACTDDCDHQRAQKAVAPRTKAKIDEQPYEKQNTLTQTTRPHEDTPLRPSARGSGARGSRSEHRSQRHSRERRGKTVPHHSSAEQPPKSDHHSPGARRSTAQRSSRGGSTAAAGTGEKQRPRIPAPTTAHHGTARPGLPPKKAPPHPPLARDTTAAPDLKATAADNLFPTHCPARGAKAKRRRGPEPPRVEDVRIRFGERNARWWEMKRKWACGFRML